MLKYCINWYAKWGDSLYFFINLEPKVGQKNPPTAKVTVTINPGSGQPKPILQTLNQVFRAAGVKWDVSLTEDSGDAEKHDREAVQAGVDLVAAFGGDGTVMKVARVVMGSKVPIRRVRN